MQGATGGDAKIGERREFDGALRLEGDVKSGADWRRDKARCGNRRCANEGSARASARLRCAIGCDRMRDLAATMRDRPNDDACERIRASA
jgi:hypothetical protein